MSNKIMAILLSAFLLLTLAPGCTASSGSLNFGNGVGNLAYDFSLPDLQGNTVTLSDLRGRPVVLNFWFVA